jgi:hypothetical protein
VTLVIPQVEDRERIHPEACIGISLFAERASDSNVWLDTDCIGLLDSGIPFRFLVAHEKARIRILILIALMRILFAVKCDGSDVCDAIEFFLTMDLSGCML